MKNLPEENFWGAIRNRLGNYSEVPADDAWDKIAGALPKQPPSQGSVWFKRIGGLMLLIGISFTTGYFLRDQQMPSASLNQALTTDDKSVNQSETKTTEHENQSNTITPKNQLKTDTLENAAKRNALKDSKGSTPDKTESVLPSKSAGENQSTRTSNRNVTNKRVAASSTPRNVQPPYVVNSQIAKSTIGETKSDKTVVDQRNLSSSDKSSAESSVNANENVTRNEPAENSVPLVASDSDLQDQSLASRDRINPSKAQTDSLTVEEKVATHETPKTPVVTEASAKKEKKKRIHSELYVGLTPSLSFHKVSPHNNDGYEVKGLESPGVFSKARLGFSLEAGLQRVVGKNLEVYGGLSVYKQTQQITYRFNDPNNVEVVQSAQGGYDITPKMTSKTFDYNMLNVGATAGFFYRIKGDLLMHKVGVGLQFQRGMLSTTSEKSYDNAHSSYLNYQLMYRVEMPIRARMSVYVQPSFNHAFWTNEKLTEPFSIKSYRAGIGFGILYRF